MCPCALSPKLSARAGEQAACVPPTAVERRADYEWNILLKRFAVADESIFAERPTRQSLQGSAGLVIEPAVFRTQISNTWRGRV